MKKTGLITTAAAAKKLGVTPRRIVQFLHAGRIKGEQFGRDWMVQETSLDAVKTRKPGRPRKLN